MVQKKQVCPFSKVACRECPIYRGRHLNLCFYRSSQAGASPGSNKPGNGHGGKGWEMPALPPRPTWLALNQFEESAFYERREE